MAQTWTDNPFSSGDVGQTDLQNIENNLLSLKSNFSGTSAPSNAVAGMHWYDSGTGNKVMKMYLDSAWVGYMHGDASQKVLVFRNTAMDGWSIDSTAGYQDKIVAIKGGSTYTTAGATAGSWTISGITSANESTHTHTVVSHNHKWYTYSGAVSTDDGTFDSNGDALNLDNINDNNKNAGSAAIVIDSAGLTSKAAEVDLYTNKTAPATDGGDAHNHTVSQDGTWRVAAAVFTLQYLDL